MGRSNDTFGKREVKAKKDKKRQEKEQKRNEKKQQGRDGKSFDDMIAYVDEFGNITSTPPDLSNKEIINAEDIEIGIPRTLASETEDNRREGIVAFFDEKKGFGFIKDVITKQNVFVHINALEEPIKENNKVTFEMIKGPKGMNAINVKIERS